MKLRRKKQSRRSLCRWEDAFTPEVKMKCLAHPDRFPLHLFDYQFIHGCLRAVQDEHAEANVRMPWTVWARNKAAEAKSARAFVKYMIVAASDAVRRRMIRVAQGQQPGEANEASEQPPWIKHLVQKFG